jgi:hypothetical protein
MPSSERNSVLISGVVSFFQIHVQREYITAEDEEDDYLYRMALEMQQRLRHEMQEQVRSTLGPEFQVQSFDIRKGIPIAKCGANVTCLVVATAVRL